MFDLFKLPKIKLKYSDKYEMPDSYRRTIAGRSPGQGEGWNVN